MCTCFHSLRILQILNQDGLSVKIEKKVSVPKLRKTFIVSIRNNKVLADFSRVQCGKIVFKVSRVLIRHFHNHAQYRVRFCWRSTTEPLFKLSCDFLKFYRLFFWGKIMELFIFFTKSTVFTNRSGSPTETTLILFCA